MSKQPAKNTAAKKPVASGRSPIIQARGVRLRASEDGPHPVAEPRDAVNEENPAGGGDAQQPPQSVTSTGHAGGAASYGTSQGGSVTLSDTFARARARDTVEVPANPKLDAARVDLDVALAAKALTNWEVAMVESLIDLRDLQDVIDAMSARQDVIRENMKLALVHSDSKTFKFNLGAATLAKGAETVSIVDAKKIPFEYMTEIPDKAKIGRALKVPIAVDGATLTEGKPSLRITWED